ncbi:MAG: magnesium transporter [Verrucomicrobia bacterium]|nr:magnesium transporter [Verrucomicrobiota bacterium]
MTEGTPIFLEEYLRLHPADLADRLQRMPADEAREILRQLPRPIASDMLAELEADKARDLLGALPSEELAAFFLELPPNAAADVLGGLPVMQRRDVFTKLPPEKVQSIDALLRYAVDTAGGIMSDRFIALRAADSVGQSQERLRGMPEQRPEDISYLYVTDDANRLVGVVTLRDLVFRNADRRIEDMMNRDVRFVRADDDQEEVARQFEHYHYMGLPVLDRQGRLVGVVKASDALRVAQSEATEDMQLMVGLSGEERALTPWSVSIKRRLPWLYVNLATAFLAAIVVGWFEDTIARWTALAIFLPIIAGQGGNAGMQTLTVIIRDLALGELAPGDGRKALIKEIILGLINGLAIGLVVGVLGYLWKGSASLGFVAGTAMLLNQLAAALSGVLIPFGLKVLKIDPALASSIFVTTVTDVAGFFFFLGLAALCMRWLGG